MDSGGGDGGGDSGCGGGGSGVSVTCGANEVVFQINSFVIYLPCPPSPVSFFLLRSRVPTKVITDLRMARVQALIKKNVGNLSAESCLPALTSLRCFAF